MTLLAQQSDLRRCLQADGGDANVHDLLCPRPSVVEKLQQCEVAPAERGGSLDGAEHVLDVSAR